VIFVNLLTLSRRVSPGWRVIYHVDVIVVGAGIVGLSCGWILAKAGRRVRVFDRTCAASEASWAGAGMLAPGGEFESDSPLSRMALRSLALYPEFVSELTAESGVAIDYRKCGGIELDAIGADGAVRAARQAEAGIRSEPCAFRGKPARFYPDDALVDPRDITRALLVACRARGVAIHENEPVTGVEENGRGVTTANGVYQSDGVVIAAGAWSSGLYPGLRPTRPVRGHLIAYRMPAAFLGSILRHESTYLMQRSSGLLIAGTSTEEVGFDRSLDENVTADIERRAADLVPELRSMTPVERWNGFRPGIAGEGPMIERVGEGSVFAAFGHYRNGILLAPETARMIGDLTASV
jgi:glycine oxidase